MIQYEIWDPMSHLILKKFTIVYGNVKSFDLLIHDFYCADQSEDDSIHSFATWIERLLSQIRDRFPDKLPHQEEQTLMGLSVPRV